MKKLLESVLSNGRKELSFWCPGCKMYHRFTVEKGVDNGPIWTWNGSMKKPTFSPSLRTLIGDDLHCHLFVRDGEIKFLGDCSHELAGRAVLMEDEE